MPDETEDEFSEFEDGVDLNEDLVPWYGVLCPEGVVSGDGRKFNLGAVDNRDLPLPLLHQDSTAEGHDGATIVARIDELWRDETDNLIKASGVFLPSDITDRVIMLVAEGALRGVSIDADDIEMYLEDAEGNALDGTEEYSADTVQAYSRVRVCAATTVAIPAFAEAFIAIGTWADHDAEQAEPEVDSELVASIAAAGDVEEFISIAPGKTEDGPGWLTHPVDTNRLRNYWVRGPGAAKIGWGLPGDFNRCRVNLAKYIKPQYLSGYCANRHYDALKTWPGRHAADTLVASAEQAPAFTLVASVTTLEPQEEEVWQAVPEWYEDPGLTEPTPLTVTDDGRIFGHLAVWGTCHIGIDGVCIEPPSSPTNYANYRLGTVQAADGTVIPVGRITMGTGHAGTNLSAARALAHYDNTGTCVGYVAAGEDQVGIWIAGQVAPNVTANQVTILRAASLSGDWRDTGGGIDLRAALAVNVPGFPIQHPTLAASGGRQTALVAAGVVRHEENPAFAVAKAAARAAIEEMRGDEKAARDMAALAAARTEKKMSELRRARMLATSGRN